MRPGFSMIYKRPDPSGCRSTGRSRLEVTSCQSYPLGSGNVVAPEGVSVAGISVGTGELGMAVGEMEVGMAVFTTGVGGTEVLGPVHEMRIGNNSKRICRLIYLFLAVVDVS